jgi:hypothetical protein
VNKIKYEPVYGNQDLFDGAPEDAEYAGWFCQEIRWYMILNGKILFSDGDTWCTSDNPYLSADIAAMRRIIAEPKRWTVDDQKAGRLPEVGSKAVSVHDFCVVDILAVRNRCIVVCNSSVDDSRPCVFTIDNFMQYYKPIESPEEKAQREEDEFVASVIDLASENHLMSCGFKDGVIAAYRKLKGGE